MKVKFNASFKANTVLHDISGNSPGNGPYVCIVADRVYTCNHWSKDTEEDNLWLIFFEHPFEFGMTTLYSEHEPQPVADDEPKQMWGLEPQPWFAYYCQSSELNIADWDAFWAENAWRSVDDWMSKFTKLSLTDAQCLHDICRLHGSTNPMSCELVDDLKTHMDTLIDYVSAMSTSAAWNRGTLYLPPPQSMDSYQTILQKYAPDSKAYPALADAFHTYVELYMRISLRYRLKRHSVSFV